MFLKTQAAFPTGGINHFLSLCFSELKRIFSQSVRALEVGGLGRDFGEGNSGNRTLLPVTLEASRVDFYGGA